LAAPRGRAEHAQRGGYRGFPENPEGGEVSGFPSLRFRRGKIFLE
jgi:hypothetical protein